jgi:hypothetical protein
MTTNWTPKAWCAGHGAVEYTPIHADPDRGLGDWEVHPQKIPHRDGNVVSLEHNGDWLAHHVSGAWLAFTPASGARAAAERMAALQNGGRQTRVVDLDESESFSAHTAQSVQAEIDAHNAAFAAAAQ